MDRQNGTWYAIDFEDEPIGGYSVSQLETLLRDCNFLDLIERPGLWPTGLPWIVLPRKTTRPYQPSGLISTSALGDRMDSIIVRDWPSD
jgi:hypothetical protein